MDPQQSPTRPHTLRSVLLDLARQQEDLAAHDAAATPYWAPSPTSVMGHRAAAAALRAEADHHLPVG